MVKCRDVELGEDCGCYLDRDEGFKGFQILDPPFAEIGEPHATLSERRYIRGSRIRVNAVSGGEGVKVWELGMVRRIGVSGIADLSRAGACVGNSV